MKESDLKFPLTIQWYDNKYIVRKGLKGLDWTILEDGEEGKTFENSVSASSLAGSLRTNPTEVKLLSDSHAAQLQVSIDTSQLEKAVALAKELEATLGRIKGMLA